MSKKDQEIVKLDDISFEIVELDEMMLEDVIGGIEANWKCGTNGSGCSSNTNCGTDPIRVE